MGRKWVNSKPWSARTKCRWRWRSVKFWPSSYLSSAFLLSWATSSLINSRFITYGCRRHYPPFGLPHHVSTVSSLHPQLDGKGLRDQDEGDLENHRLRVLDLHPLHACTKAIWMTIPTVTVVVVVKIFDKDYFDAKTLLALWILLWLFGLGFGLPLRFFHSYRRLNNSCLGPYFFLRKEHLGAIPILFPKFVLHRGDGRFTWQDQILLL